jgi:hypothetical protein
MLHYRIYCLNHEGGFSKVEEIEATDDAEALARARALRHSGRCEVWLRNRFVGVVNEDAAA